MACSICSSTCVRRLRLGPRRRCSAGAGTVVGTAVAAGVGTERGGGREGVGGEEELTKEEEEGTNLPRRSRGRLDRGVERRAVAGEGPGVGRPVLVLVAAFKRRDGAAVVVMVVGVFPPLAGGEDCPGSRVDMLWIVVELGICEGNGVCVWSGPC